MCEPARGPDPELRAGSTGLERLVEQTWRRILGIDTASGCWDELGGDSLKLLQCVMELEGSIGRELNLEAFTIDMTASEMVAAIASGPNCAAACDDMSNALPLVFLLPGSVGYGPSLAMFGAELDDVVRVASIRYPDLGSMLRGRGSVVAMAEAAVRQIALVQPDGDVRLLGYSLGGGVAFEVASRLIAAGRSVKFFGVLDTSVDSHAGLYRETIARTIQRIRSHRVTVYRMFCRAVAKGIARFSWEVRFAALLDRNWRGRLAGTHFMLKLELEEVLRMRAFGDWRDEPKPKPKLPIAATLFRCNRTGASPDLGWRALFEELEIVPIAGGHLDLMIEPSLAWNRPLIAGALAASST